MRRAFSILVFFLAAITASGQSVQQVLVKEYKGREQKSPLGAVSITVTNAASTASDAGGQASLRFRTLRAGDKVDVRRIEKMGYEVFNSQALESWAISPNTPFTIILCQSARLRQLRETYMSASSASYERQHKKDRARLEELRRQAKVSEAEFQKQMQELEDEYDEQLENLENYVDQFARIDLSEISGKENEIISLVQEGRMEEAVKLYESYDFQGKYEKEAEEIRKIEESQNRLAELEKEKLRERDQIEAAIGRQVATYRLAGGRENFEKITRLLRQVADADMTNWKAVYTYARHANNMMFYGEAEKYLAEGMAYHKDDDRIQADGLQLLAFCYKAERQYAKCEETMLARHEILARAKDRSLFAYASSQRDIFSLYVDTGQMDKAKQWGASARESFETLYQDPDEGKSYWGSLSQVYGDESLLLLNDGDQDGAIALALKSYGLCRDNMKENDDVAELFYARALSGLIMIYYSIEDWSSLEKYTLESMRQMERCYKVNPDKYVSDLMGAYSNVAEADLHLEKYKECEEYFLKADAILAKLFERFGDMMANDAFALYDIGAKLYSAMNDKEKSHYYAQKAVENYEKMPAEDQEADRELADELRKM